MSLGAVCTRTNDAAEGILLDLAYRVKAGGLLVDNAPPAQLR